MLMMLAGFRVMLARSGGFLQRRAADAHDAGRVSPASCNVARLMLVMLAG